MADKTTDQSPGVVLHLGKKATITVTAGAILGALSLIGGVGIGTNKVGELVGIQQEMASAVKEIKDSKMEDLIKSMRTARGEIDDLRQDHDFLKKTVNSHTREIAIIQDDITTLQNANTARAQKIR